MQQGNLRPLGDRILVERLEGHGIERTTDGGIVIPATTEGTIRSKGDYFRARVVAVGPKAARDVEPGEHVLVFAWADGDGSKLYTGVDGLGKHELFIGPDDVVCAVAPETVLDDVRSPAVR